MADLDPRLETARLLLHRHRPEDFDASALMWKDPRVTRFIGGKPSTDEDCWMRRLRTVGHWEVLGFGYLAVREKSSGRFLGEVGLADFHRAIVPPFDGAPEVGWAFTPDAHGKGYATEAVQALIDWGGERLGSKRFVCMIDPTNAASFRVAEKCGFREYARSEYHGSPTVLLECVR